MDIFVIFLALGLAFGIYLFLYILFIIDAINKEEVDF